LIDCGQYFGVGVTKPAVIRWARMIKRLSRDFAEARNRLGLASHRTQGNRDFGSIERLSFVVKLGRNCKPAADRGTTGSPED